MSSTRGYLRPCPFCLYLFSVRDPEVLREVTIPRDKRRTLQSCHVRLSVSRVYREERVFQPTVPVRPKRDNDNLKSHRTRGLGSYGVRSGSIQDLFCSARDWGRRQDRPTTVRIDQRNPLNMYVPSTGPSCGLTSATFGFHTLCHLPRHRGNKGRDLGPNKSSTKFFKFRPFSLLLFVSCTFNLNPSNPNFRSER